MASCSQQVSPHTILIAHLITITFHLVLSAVLLRDGISRSTTRVCGGLLLLVSLGSLVPISFKRYRCEQVLH